MLHSAILRVPRRLQRLLIALAATAAAAVIGWIDAELGVSLWALYVFPIAVTSWFVGWRLGIMMATLCGTLATVAHLGALPGGAGPWTAAWYLFSVALVYSLAAVFPSRVSLELLAQSQLAREDVLTHVPNRLWFNERLPLEMSAAAGRQTAITLGLVEVHGLAYVNERFGTIAGDHVLRSTAATLREALGKGDLIGRLSGTTFAVVLPGKGEQAARSELENVRDQVLRKINLYDRPISIAIAAVSTDQPNREGQNLMDRTGWLLHSIKQDRTLHPFRVVGEHQIQA